jgi:hypothetical protein
MNYRDTERDRGRRVRKRRPSRAGAGFGAGVAVSLEAPVLESFVGAIDSVETEVVGAVASGGVASVSGASRRWQRPSL